MVGGVIGAVVGGLAGKAAAEAVNPTAEEEHWREAYTREPYYEQGRTFDDYGPAYRHGLEGRMRHEGDWDTAEPRLASEWETSRAGSELDWQQARPASRAAWDRVDTLRGGGTGSMASDTAVVRSNDLAGSGMAMTGGTDMRSDTMAGTRGMGSDRSDVVDTLQDLVECCKDGEYGFRESAEQVKREDLRSTLLQRADECRRAADELNNQIRACGGKVEDGGSAAGAMHRGWVSVRSALTTYDDKAVLEECERGEDNAKARYMKALKKGLPAEIQQLVEKQYQGLLRNHDQVKMLRDQLRAM
jgi:uncharacterized protein (TIGR02284 family)